jgi:hypothetical protein
MRRNPAPPVCALTLEIAPAVAELTPFSANPRFRSLNGESCRVGIVELKVHLKALGIGHSAAALSLDDVSGDS